jgi:hypothetical protein
LQAVLLFERLSGPMAKWPQAAPSGGPIGAPISASLVRRHLQTGPDVDI